MKSVLISIHPKWCELIASGKKTIEVRKTRPKIATPFKVYIYCTKQGKRFFHGGIGEKECLFKNPDTGEIKFDFSFELMCCRSEYTKDNFLSGKVIGEFVCRCIGKVGWTSNPSKKDWQDGYNEETCLTNRETYEYTKGELFYEWHISDLVIYDKPRELSEFYNNCDGLCFDNSIKYKCTRFNPDSPYACDHIKPITRAPQSWCYVESEDTE